MMHDASQRLHEKSIELVKLPIADDEKEDSDSIGYDIW
jgi:hypothetical protein